MQAKSKSKSLTRVVLTLVLVTMIGLTGCGGGGGGGGGGGNLPSFLSFSSFRFGNVSAGLESATPYPTVPINGVPVPPGGAVTVPPAVFAPGVPASQDYLELTFNLPVLATTIFNPSIPGSDGIALFKMENGVATAVGLVLDSAGVLNPANAFPNSETAPAIIRLYVDADSSLTTPDTFQPGDYVLQLNENLKSFSGGPLCTGFGSANCVNSYLPVFSFTVGAADTSALSMSVTAPSIPVGGDPAVGINREIILNFTEAVDFTSLVGAGNLTLQDPFITKVRTLFELSCFVPAPPPPGAPPPPPTAIIPSVSDAGHLILAYTPPTDPASLVQESLPANLGFVVYMPDPILNPTQVRIRFVDNTNLVGTGIAQNYASNPRRLPIPSANGILQMPPIQPVPGSLDGATGIGDMRAATVDIFIMSVAFLASPPLPGPPDDVCYAPTTGVLDRSGNSIDADFHMTFAWDVGPPVASNPQPPDATIIGTQTGTPGLGALNTAGATTDAGPPGSNTPTPITYGSSITGTMQMAPDRLANTAILGTPLDIEIGAWINLNTATNNISNPGRADLLLPGVPDDPNGNSPMGLLALVGLGGGPPLQPLGNYLYVVDGDSGTVKVFNSYNWQLMTTLVGIASPRGLGMAPNLSYIYISNFNQGTVTRVFANPAAPTLHTVTNIVAVGSGPTAVAVQGQNKDVFVTNFVDNSYSRITVGTQLERASFATGVGPNEVVCGLEMLGQGTTNAYLTYIYNFFDDSVSVWESESFATPENNPNGKEVARKFGLSGPTGGCWNWQTYTAGTFEPGCFVANGQGTTVDEMTMFQWALSPQPGQPGLPGFRRFHTLKAYNSFLVGQGSAPKDVSIDAHSGLYNVFAAGVTNNKSIIDPVFNGSGSVPSLVLCAFPGQGTVGIFDYSSPALFGTVSVPGCDLLVGYYDQ